MGKVVVRSDTVAEENHQVSFFMVGSKMTSFAFFSSIAPMIEISKPVLTKELKKVILSGDYDIQQLMSSKEVSGWVKVYQSPLIKKGTDRFP